MTQQFHLWVYTQKNWNQELKQIFVHPYSSSIIHNNQKVEATRVSIDG